MDYADIKESAREFDEEVQAIKAATSDVPWYPYGSIGNIWNLEAVISADELVATLSRGPILDIGAADGDLSFFAEQIFGAAVTAVDNSPTNYNGLRGFRALKQALGSGAELIDCDLDSYFGIEGRYHFAFFLGILYHLKNPFYVLEQLALRVERLVLSTRVTNHAAPNGADISAVPCAYLLGAGEANGDATNFWIFTEAGLRKLFERTGWTVISYEKFGAKKSDPFTPEGDQRAFCYLESHRFHKGSRTDR